MKDGKMPGKLSKPERPKGLELVRKGSNKAAEERKVTEISSGKE